MLIFWTTGWAFSLLMIESQRASSTFVGGIYFYDRENVCHAFSYTWDYNALRVETRNMLMFFVSWCLCMNQTVVMTERFFLFGITPIRLRFPIDLCPAGFPSLQNILGDISGEWTWYENYIPVDRNDFKCKYRRFPYFFVFDLCFRIDVCLLTCVWYLYEFVQHMGE